MNHQRGEEEDERNSEDSTGHRRKDDDAAGDVDGGNHGRRGESMDQRESRDGYEEAEETTAGVLKEVEVVGGSEEEEAPAPLFAHPCSLLRLLLRACAGCLSMHGYCSDDDDDDPKPAADDDDAAAPAVVAESSPPQEGDHQGGGGDDDKAASYLCVQGEVVTRAWAVRRPTAPGRCPVEGSGGNGGHHH